ncbi:MAG TPA: phage tail length tape measure family protein, partial [Brevundimonas sp.]|nr:phage tail length tape measure family protein [Brevundimonas sp.]
MSNATIGALRVVLGLDTAQFTGGLTAAQKRLRGVGRDLQNIGAGFATVGAGLTAAVTAPLIAAGFAASKAATEAADAMGQVESALASMGDASGRTKEQLAGLADGLMRNSLYDDDDILRKVTANLLTFGRISGANFDRAQQSAVNLATRMKMDLQPATLLVGKALNDPIKGLTAMGRAGIQFTAAQKQTIKSMVEAGDVAGAQAIILGELERQFGGAAAAAQRTDPYDRFRDSLNAVTESAGGIVNRFMVPFLGGVAGLLDGFNALNPAMQQFVIGGAAIAAALGPVLIGVGA